MNFNPNILILEDNPGDARLIKEILNDVDISHDLYFANEGEVALQMLKHEGEYSNIPRPDLILLDINLPIKDGKEVLKDINQHDKLNKISIIILINSLSDIDNDPYAKLVDAVLLKSPNLEGFEKIVNCA